MDDHPREYDHRLPQVSNEVDVSLIRWMLSLDPAERLEVLQGWVDDLAELRDAFTEVEAQRASRGLGSA